ncbi:5-carboxymethyl-2-hydroxymuconate delta-isomerase, partial [Escherichia sp. TWPC-MK]
MPHFIVECTENIREEARLPEPFARYRSSAPGYV